MDLVSLDLEYLRPPFEASFINHNLDYIRSGSGKNSKRRIFYNVSFETSELKAIQDLEDLLKSQGIDLPSEWNSSETLKFLYAEKFDLESAAEMIKTCLEWRANPRTSVIDERVLQLFELGVIYIWGLDAQYRPILIINLNKLKQVEMDEETEDIFKIALVIMFDIIRTYCFLPRKIENWIMIVDARGVQTIEADHIQSIVYLIRCCFPSTLERLFVITSLNFRLSHQNLIQSIADKSDLEDIQLIATSEINELQKYIPPESLEKKYGGECPNLETFWPPAKRNETYQRTSVTSLKQYSDSGSLKGNISTKRGNYDTTFGEFGKPNLFTENMDPKSIESSRVDQSKLQPNQLGLSSYSQGHPKKAHDAFNRNTYSGDNNIVESVLVTRSPTKFENVKNASQPQSAQKSMNSSPGKQRGNDPFQARKLEGEEVNTRNRLDTSNYSNRTSELPSDFFVTQVAEMPKNKPKNLWDGKVESLGYNRQLSNNPSIERSNSRAQSRRENDSGFYSRDRNLEASPPHQNHPYAGLGFQRENMRNLDGSPQNYGMYGTFEENDENATSRISYSQKDKEQIKRRLIEISAKKQEESEEDAKSKKGLFCGCCVEKKKKARKSSRAKRSKYV